MRKLVIGSMVFVLVTLGWSRYSLGEQAPRPRGEIRIVDKHPLNWAWLTWNTFEHLIELDTNGQEVPKLATGWKWLDDRTLEMTLRQGVTFHNGEVFDAEIVKLNWEENTRLRQPHMPGEYLNFHPGSKIEIIDSHTVQFVFPEPDGAAIAKFTFMHIANRQFYKELGWGEKSW